MPRTLGRCCWLPLLTLVAACAVSPQPEPPSIAAETVSILLDGSGVARVLGDPGTVTPPGAVVVARNLDAPMDPGPVQVVSGPDGSFQLELAGMEGESVRLQAVEGDVRSRPIDLVGPPPGMRPRPPMRPLPCFVVADGSYLDLGPVLVGDVQSARAQLRNDCPGEVVVEGVFPRPGSPGVFAMSGAPPVVIPPGTTRFFIVTFAPLEPGPVEALVDVRIGPPEPHLRPVTVIGLGVVE